MIVGLLGNSIEFIVTILNTIRRCNLILANLIHKHTFPVSYHKRKPPKNILLEHPRIFKMHNIPLHPFIIFLILNPAILSVILTIFFNTLFFFTRITATITTLVWYIHF
jgi:hypothetical protein